MREGRAMRGLEAKRLDADPLDNCKHVGAIAAAIVADLAIEDAATRRARSPADTEAQAPPSRRTARRVESHQVPA